MAHVEWHLLYVDPFVLAEFWLLLIQIYLTVLAFKQHQEPADRFHAGPATSFQKSGFRRCNSSSFTAAGPHSEGTVHTISGAARGGPCAPAAARYRPPLHDTGVTVKLR